MLRLSNFILLLLVFSSSVSAHFSIDKSRLYFDRNNRFQTLTIRNNSEVPISYTVKVNHVDMTEEGRILPVADENDVRNSAKKLLRYSPRRGSILPGGSQILRFIVRKPAGLESGEYRSQLRIEGGLQNDPNMLAARVAYNLPIIVRHGQTEATADLEYIGIGPSTQGKDAKELTLWIKRTGNRSLFGNFLITNENGEVIGQTKGMSVYEPISRRMARIDLTGDPTSKITVKYEELTEYGGTNNVKKVFPVR